MKPFYVFFVFVMIFGCVACQSDTEPANLMKAREIAWESLDESSKATVTSDWRTASVKTMDETYRVFFNTTEDAMLGPIGVIINRQTFEVVEYTPRY